MHTDSFQRRRSRPPRVGRQYTILAVLNEDKSYLVGKVATIDSVAPGQPGGWHCFTARIEGMLGSFDLLDGAQLKRHVPKCNCRAFAFPHKPGEGCSIFQKENL